MIPFRIGVQVTGHDFCPRNDEIKSLRECMASLGRVYLVGERRIGKTSLIAEAARSLKKSNPIFIDLMAVKDIEDFTHRLAQALIRSEKQQNRLLSLVKSLSSLRPSISMDPNTESISVTFAPGSGAQLETLDEIFDAIENGKHSIVVLDEFQDLLDVPDSRRVIAKLRGLIQQQQTAAFVFCGSIRNQMEEIFTDEQSPFFNAATRLPVGPLDRTLFRMFLLRRFQKGARLISPSLLDSIIDACHDNPGHVQRFCISLWQATSTGQSISEADIAAAWSVLFSMQRDSYELILTTLSPQQTRVLHALAQSNGSSTLSSTFIASTGITLAPSVRKAMTKLMARRLVQKTKTTYHFCDPFLAVWLRNLERGNL